MLMRKCAVHDTGALTWLQVKDGRWAYMEMQPMMHNDPGGVDPDVYSKLRAPWNVNDRP